MDKCCDTTYVIYDTCDDGFKIKNMLIKDRPSLPPILSNGPYNSTIELTSQMPDLSPYHMQCHLSNPLHHTHRPSEYFMHIVNSNDITILWVDCNYVIFIPDIC